MSPFAAALGMRPLRPIVRRRGAVAPAASTSASEGTARSYCCAPLLVAGPGAVGCRAAHRGGAATRPLAHPLAICSPLNGLSTVLSLHPSSQVAFSTFAGSALKAGMIFIHGDKYCEVVSNRQVKQGRGSASIQLEYVDLSSKKQLTLNLPVGAKVEKVEVERQTALVQYLDEDARELVVSDHHFEDVRLAATLVGDGAKLLEPGDELQVFYHDSTIVKVVLPNSIVSRMKKK